MNDDDYRKLLSSIYDRYIRPRRFHLGRRIRHHLGDEWLYHLDSVERAVRLTRFIESECDGTDDISHTFTPGIIKGTVQSISNSLDFADHVMAQGGFYDAIDAFGPEITAGLKPKHLPRFDDEVLKGLGSPDADLERRALVRLAKAQLEREAGRPNDVPVPKRIDRARHELHEARSEFENAAKSTAGEDEVEPPTKSPKWFKGLGQIGQGAALSIANVAVAVGAFHIPVSPETKTWGSIVSVVTGIGTILNGIGDLRAE
jgi:hypothetical protein